METVHIPHPNGQPHPFKMLTICGKMVRFGSVRILKSEDPSLIEKPANCKTCIRVFETLCPTCKGTGVKA